MEEKTTQTKLCFTTFQSDDRENRPTISAQILCATRYRHFPKIPAQRDQGPDAGADRVAGEAEILASRVHPVCRGGLIPEKVFLKTGASTQGVNLHGKHQKILECKSL